MTRHLVAWLFLVAAARLATAADYRVEPSKDPASDVVPKGIAAQISDAGIKVMRDEKRTVCEIWPAKAWPTTPDFKPTSAVLYPFQVGQLMGVVRFKRKSHDFKDQEIESGVYTLRYGNQPVDGNHVGTSDTRDFLLLVPADADLSPEPMAEKDLFKLSAKAAGTKHPAMFSLVKPQPSGDAPAVRHDDEHDWWILRFAADPKADASRLGSVIELVVAGKTTER